MFLALMKNFLARMRQISMCVIILCNFLQPYLQIVLQGVHPLETHSLSWVVGMQALNWQVCLKKAKSFFGQEAPLFGANLPTILASNHVLIVAMCLGKFFVS
jgi:hypothetical protein